MVFTINIKNTEGQTVTTASLHYLDQNGNAVGGNNPLIVPMPSGTASPSSSDNSTLNFKVTAPGYKDKTFVAQPGVNNVVLEKDAFAAPVEAAKKNWWLILLIVIVVAAIVWYIYKRKGNASSN